MNHKLKSLLLALLTVLTVVLAGSFGGIAAAQTTTTDSTTTEEPTDDESAEIPQEETFSVDNDTESVRAVAINTSGTLNVSVYTVDENGTETLVSSGTLNTSAVSGDSDIFAYQIPDSETDVQYRVNVSAETQGAGAETVEIEKLQAMSGGGLLPGGAGSGDLPIYVGGLLLVVGAAVLGWRQMDA
ncbi:hypothetical protein [Halorientalis halophila]|uniref:hypothetical protein n=1 Tax=Halorientalis halophila TaxID=3108499 RepID=UPI003008EFB6